MTFETPLLWWVEHPILEEHLKHTHTDKSLICKQYMVDFKATWSHCRHWLFMSWTKELEVSGHWYRLKWHRLPGAEDAVGFHICSSCVKEHQSMYKLIYTELHQQHFKEPLSLHTHTPFFQPLSLSLHFLYCLYTVSILFVFVCHVPHSDMRIFDDPNEARLHMAAFISDVHPHEDFLSVL